MDKRLLISRSEYFKEMLSEPKWKEARTNTIDLRPGPLSVAGVYLGCS